MAATPLTRGLPPTHPGELLKEIVVPALKAAGTPKTKVPELLQVGRRTLYDLMDGRTSVSPDMALRLGKLCGNSAEFWMNLQQAWDLAKAREALGPTLEAIPTLQAAE